MVIIQQWTKAAWNKDMCTEKYFYIYNFQMTSNCGFSNQTYHLTRWKISVWIIFTHVSRGYNGLFVWIETISRAMQWKTYVPYLNCLNINLFFVDKVHHTLYGIFLGKQNLELDSLNFSTYFFYSFFHSSRVYPIGKLFKHQTWSCSSLS